MCIRDSLNGEEFEGAGLQGCGLGGAGVEGALVAETELTPPLGGCLFPEIGFNGIIDLSNERQMARFEAYSKRGSAT